MPTIVASRMIQSSEFMPGTARKWPATPRPAQKRRRQKDKPRPTCESPEPPEKRHRLGEATATSFSERNQIGKQPVCARHPCWQLPEENQPCVDIITFA